MQNRFLNLTVTVAWVLLMTGFITGCATTSSTQQPPSSSPPSSSSQSSSSSGTSSSMPTPSGMPGNQGQTSPPQGQNERGESAAAGDQQEAAAGASAGDPMEGPEGDMAGGDDSLEGMGVEDAASDAVLEQALEVFDASDVGSQGGETGAEPSEDILLEETEPTVAGGAEAEGSDVLGGEGDLQGGQGEPGSDAGRVGQGSHTGGTMSDAEELATLNSNLDKALERFDGSILVERSAISERENVDAGGLPAGEEEGEGAGEIAAAGSMGAASGAESMGADSGDSSQSGDGGMPARPGSGRQGDYRHTAASDSIPPDIPDGSDDDVVARQIREAAMAEKDPELREKLWEEYRKYKKS